MGRLKLVAGRLDRFEADYLPVKDVESTVGLTVQAVGRGGKVACLFFTDGTYLRCHKTSVSRKRVCQRCKEPFDVLHGKKKFFCGVSCKLKDYRERLAKARDLAAEGVPIEEIARTLRSTVTAVTRWITGK